MGSLVIGIVAGLLCFWGAPALKTAMGYDDSLEPFGVHGVGGFIGAMLTGVFAVEGSGGDRQEGADRRQCRPGPHPAVGHPRVASPGAPSPPSSSSRSSTP
jgi:hypothetical protein